MSRFGNNTSYNHRIKRWRHERSRREALCEEMEHQHARGDQEQMSKPISITEWIQQQEDRDCPIEEFYARLVNAKLALEERIACAEGDDVDVMELDLEGVDD